MPELRKDPVTGTLGDHRDRARAQTRRFRAGAFARAPIHGRFCPFCPGNEAKTPPEVLAYRQESAPISPAGRCAWFPISSLSLASKAIWIATGEGIFDRIQGVGAHEVMVETPNHLLSITDLSDKAIEQVLWAFRDRMADLKNDRRLRYVLLFKNQGEAAGRDAGTHPLPVHRFTGRAEARAGGNRRRRACTNSKSAASSAI